MPLRLASSEPCTRWRSRRIAASHGVRLSSPLHRSSGSRPLPTAVADGVRQVGTTRPVSFRARGFSPPPRLAPRSDSQVCCTLHPVLGFTTFRTSRDPVRRSARPTPTLPVVPEPFEEFPSSPAVPRHRGRCPPDVSPETPQPPASTGAQAGLPPLLGCSSLPKQAATSPPRVGARGGFGPEGPIRHGAPVRAWPPERGEAPGPGDGDTDASRRAANDASLSEDVPGRSPSRP